MPTNRNLFRSSKRLSAITNQLEDLRNQEKSQSEGAVDAESRTKRMEELMEEEEKMQRRLEEEIKTLNFQLFKKQQVVQELATKKKNFEGDIQVGCFILLNCYVK